MLLELFIAHMSRYLPQPFGIKVRRAAWRKLFKRCGKGLDIYESVMIRKPQNIEIGNNVSINEFCYLHGKGGIVIGDNVRIAPAVGIFSFNHKFADRKTPIVKQGYDEKEVFIGQDCWIGYGVTITAGVRLGRGCVVGAGAVVTGDFPDYSVIAGVPAKVIGRR